MLLEEVAAAMGYIHGVYCPHPLNCMVLMLKPKVGLMVVMSSLFKRLTIVVLPALSKPLQACIACVSDAIGGACVTVHDMLTP